MKIYKRGRRESYNLTGKLVTKSRTIYIALIILEQFVNLIHLLRLFQTLTLLLKKNNKEVLVSFHFLCLLKNRKCLIKLTMCKRLLKDHTISKKDIFSRRIKTCLKRMTRPIIYRHNLSSNLIKKKIIRKTIIKCTCSKQSHFNKL